LHINIFNCLGHGHRKVFFPGGDNSGFFQNPEVVIKIFSGTAKNDEILFFLFESKKTTFFAKSVIGKCQFSKFKRGKPRLPQSAAHALGVPQVD